MRRFAIFNDQNLLNRFESKEVSLILNRLYQKRRFFCRFFDFFTHFENVTKTRNINRFEHKTKKRLDFFGKRSYNKIISFNVDSLPFLFIILSNSGFLMNFSPKKTKRCSFLRKKSFLSFFASSSSISWILLLFFSFFSVLGNGLHYWIPDSCQSGWHHFSLETSISIVNHSNDLHFQKNDFCHCHWQHSQEESFLSVAHCSLKHENDCPVCHFCSINHGILPFYSDCSTNISIFAKTLISSDVYLTNLVSSYFSRAPPFPAEKLLSLELIRKYVFQLDFFRNSRCCAEMN